MQPVEERLERTEPLNGWDRYPASVDIETVFVGRLAKVKLESPWMHTLPVKVCSQSYERDGILGTYAALHGQKGTI